MHLAPLIYDLAIILGVAGPVALLFQRLKQPVVLGYIIAGMIVGPHTPPYPLIKDIPSIKIWAELGVICLMFSLGLEFSFRKLVRVGFSAGITACFEVAFMLVAGFFLGKLFGWSSLDSVFLGSMLSISSTTIIVKALDELGLKSRRFSELIFAVLIVEDLVAILILVALSTLGTNQSFSSFALFNSAAKLVLIVGSWFVGGYFLLPRFVKYVGRVGSNEILTLLALGLCLALVVFAAHFHYSTALGAFIMGSILAESTESHRIEERIEPIRDLFSAVFFVSVGMLIDFHTLIQNLGAVALICVVTILGKVFSSTLGALITGQTLRTSVQVGFGLAQIGEFSFIIAGLGHTLNITSDFLYPIGVAVSIITTFTTPYLIRISHKFAVGIEERLPFSLREVMNRYASWIQARQLDTARKKDFYQLLFRWLTNALIVTVIFIVAADRFLPFLMEREFGSKLVVRAIAWLVSVLMASPFIWAMTFFLRGDAAHSGRSHSPIFVHRGLIHFISQFASLILIGVLSLQFFPGTYVILIFGGLASVLFLMFYRQIEASYHWFESQFLSTFEDQEKTKSPTDLLRHLAPWDAHLVRIKVHPNANLVMKKLSELRLRTDYGINVVAIQRGLVTSVAPKPSEAILPHDELLVLGTDEEIDALKASVERPLGSPHHYKPISGYELGNVKILDHSPLAGHTIRNSGIREQFHCMVVGMERGSQRIINPESDIQLLPGDILWIVGSSTQLNLLLTHMSSIEQVPAELADDSKQY
jgi:monovalent cation:H+ antiporter-2, CPA2 family